MSTPITNSTLKQELIDAANLVYKQNASLGAGGITPLIVNGAPVSNLNAAAGFYAQAYIDTTGNVIIAYEGSNNSNGIAYDNGSAAADLNLLDGIKAPALQYAVDFANTVHQLVNSAPIYVTGHSLGGAEAAAAASNLNFIAGGLTFAAPGLPVAARGSVSPTNFLNYVEYSDPVGNAANDAVNLYYLTYVPPTMGSHYGPVTYIGSTFSEIVSYLPLIGSATLDILLINAKLRHDAPTHALDFYASDLGLVLHAPVVIPQDQQATVTSQLNSKIAARISAQVIATTPTLTSTSYPIILGPSSASVETNSTTLLSSWFSATEKPSGSVHHIDHYLAFLVRGAGNIVVGNQTYELGSIASNISQSAFATAAFNAGANSGLSEVALIAVDDAGTPSVAGDITVTVATPAVAPAPIIVTASINQPVNTTFLLQPFLSLPAPPSGRSISLVNFINTHTGPGQLTFGGTPTSGNEATAYANVGQVGFSTGSVVGSDRIQMYATYSDGTTSNVVDLTINIKASSPPPPPPQNTSGPVVSSNVQPLQVIVGHSGIFSNTNLSAADAAYPDLSQITYNVVGYPTKGFFYDNGQLAHSFTQADINAGRIVYQASFQVGLASETSDSFTYIVSDPSFRQSTITTATVKIEPLPAPPQTSQPYLDTNVFPLVREGSQIQVLGVDLPGGAANLHVTDNNPNIPFVGSSKDSIIVYTVTQGPIHGKLLWFTDTPTLALPGQPSYFGQQVTQFTQTDLHNGWFIYRNDLTSGAADQFSFTVSDGFGGTIGLTTATIPIQPVNPIILKINTGMFVTSGGQSILSSDWLRIEDIAPNANLKLTVKQAPSHGTILLSGQQATVFTVNNLNQLTYVQNGSSASSDQFVIGVTDAYGNSIPDLVVPIAIGPNALDRNTGILIGVGQSVSIGGTNLHVADPGLGSGNPYADTPPYLIYTLTKLPTHGALSITGSTLHVGDQFTQDQLDQNRLIYTEDGSTASLDSFEFSIADAFVHNSFGSGIFNISIINNNGGQIFQGSSAPRIFYSGPGNNWVGGSGTTVSYELAPAAVTVDLTGGSASNGFGGKDTFVGVHSIIGSSYDDRLIVGSGNNTFDGGLGSDTAVFSGSRSQYTITHLSDGSFQVADQRNNSPNGTTSLSNVEFFQFSDGAFHTANQAPALSVISAISVQPNQWLQATPAALAALFNVTDGDGDPVATYRFTDVGAGANSTRLWSGGYLAQGGTIDVAAAQLSSLWLQGGPVNGSDTLRVQVSDGFDWSVAKDISVLTRGPNNLPVVTAATTSQAVNAVVAFKTLFNVSDADGDAITQYRINDMTGGGARLQLNNALQAENTPLVFSAADVDQGVLQLVASSVSRNVNRFSVEANDGFGWSAAKTIDFTSLGPNAVPVVNVLSSLLIGPNQWLQATPAALAALFNVTDGDGDPVATYRFTDVGAGANSTRLWSGGYLAQGGTIDVAAAQLSSLWLQGGPVNGSDTLRVQVSDGFDWSVAKDISVLTRGPNNLPVVTAATTSQAVNAVVAFKTLFNVSDADGDAITQYRINDMTGGGARLQLNNALQAENTPLVFSAADVDQGVLQLVASSVSRNVNRFSVEANDGFGWSAAKTIDFTSLGPNAVPVVNVLSSLLIGPNQWLQATPAALAALFNVTDGDGDPVATYRFTDVGAGANSTRLWSGGYLAQGGTIDVAAAQLSSLWLQGGPVNGSDTLRVQVSDGFDWSVAKDISVLTRGPNNLPVVTAATTSQAVNAVVAFKTLFNVSDADGDAITQYRINDMTGGGARLQLNNALQAENTPLVFSAADVDQGVLQLVASSVSRNVNRFSVEANDGFGWSAAKTIDFTSLGPNAVPVVNVLSSLLIGPNQWLQATPAALAALFNVTDGDGDPVATYRFTDVGAGANSTRLWSGGYLAQGGTIDVAAAQLSSLWLQGGPVNGSDTLRVQVSDGFDWSVAKDISVLTRGPNNLPVVTAATTSQAVNAVVAFKTLFNVSDADGDAITQYRINDMTGGGARLQLNNALQAENTPLVFSAADVDQGVLQLVASSVSRNVNRFSVEANDGFGWSAAKTIDFTSLGPNAVPVVNVLSSLLIGPNQWLQATPAALAALFNVTDGDGDPVATYRFTDVGAGANSTRLWSGGYLAQGGTIDVAAAQLSSLWLQGGPVNGSDTLRVQVSDGFDWSAAKDISVLTRGPNNLPVVTGATTSGTINTNVALSSLFNVTDTDGDPITQYRITDVTTGFTSAHLVLNGQWQQENFLTFIDPANIASWQIATSSVNRNVNAFTVQASDGFDWSAPTTIKFTSIGPNVPPVINVLAGLQIGPNQWVQASAAGLSLLFNVTDGDNDPVVTYRFTDVSNAASSMRLWGPGGYLPQGGTVDIAASQLTSGWLQGGSATGDDILRVQVFDGFDWSQPADIPVLTRSTQLVAAMAAFGNAQSASSATNISDALGQNVFLVPPQH